MSVTLSCVPNFTLKFSWVTILQGIEFSIFLFIFAWALQQCSASALPIMVSVISDVSDVSF